MQKTRVMQITHDMGVGGLPRVVETICRKVDRDRFDMSVLCLNAEGPLADSVRGLGMRVFNIGRATENGERKPDRLAFLKVARLLRAERIDVIHTHNTQPFLDGVVGGILAGTRTMIHTDHARSFPDKWKYMMAERVLSTFTHRVVGVSDHTARNLATYEKIPRSKIVTIPNGIDGSPYQVPVDVAAKRRELNVPPSGPLVGFASRLVEQKGIPYLLQAMPELLRRFPDMTLVIAGEGPDRAPLERQAAEIGVQGRVRFVGVRLDLPELLRVFDIMVLPSLWEGLPMVILEAMAAGCPIVATAVGGVPTALENGKSALLVQPRDPVALVEALSTMIASPEQRARYAAAARAIFEARFTAEAMTREYERLYLRQPLLQH